MKILLIARHFPPEQSGGAGRPYSLYKYLPGHGIEPLILTVDSYGTMANETGIYRTMSLMTWKNRKSPFYNFFRSSKIANGIVPNMDIIWEKTALGKAAEIFRRNEIKLIYATYPSTSALRLGLWLSRRYKVPLISEFRDGLVYEPLFHFNPASFLWTTRFERRLIGASSAVVTIGNELSRYFRERYGLKNVFTVHNGYDRDDFAAMPEPASNKNGKFRAAHFGNLMSSSKKRRGSDLFLAVSRLKRDEKAKNKELSEEFGLFFFGNFLKPEKKMIRDLGVGDIVEFHRPVGKKEGFRLLMENFDALLFIGAKGSKTVISSKLPEYLYMNKPIIGICQGNEAEEIIERTGTGEVCGFDADSICSLLKRAIGGKIAFNPKKEEILKFARASQAESISEIIKEAIARKNKKGP